MWIKIKPTYNTPQEGTSPAEETAPVETPAPASGAEGDSAFDMLDFFTGMEKEYDEAPEDTGAESGTPVEQTGGQQEETQAVTLSGGAPTQAVQGQPPVTTPTGGQPQTQPVVQQQATPNLGTQEQQPQAQAQPQQQVVTPTQRVEPQDAIAQLAAEVEKQKEVFTQQLADGMYKLSEAQQQELLENPGAFVAKALAQVHVNVTASLSKMMATHIPAVVMGTVNAQVEDRKREERFFAAHPQLKREHMPLILEIGNIYNKVNPTSTEDDFRRDVGLLVSMRLGLPAQAPAQANGSQPQVNLHQQQVAVRTPGQVVRQVAVPYQPGGARGAPAQPGSQPPKSEWEQLFDYVRLEESGALDT